MEKTFATLTYYIVTQTTQECIQNLLCLPLSEKPHKTNKIQLH